MVKRMSLPRILLLLLTLLNSTILAKSASGLLREGLYAEEVEGDLSAAIKIYQQVIEDDSAQENLVAQALYRQGMCHMKLKNELEAKAAFSKLMTQHADQTQLIEKVKPLLDELGNADPASLMPPETIMYLEIGSPGKQIETILNMLQGTPFENPLAMMGGGNQWSGEEAGPANMIGALMNPSMMAEFKKIRGMGIGITGLEGLGNDGPPPALVVLYPGQSDALRGLLLAGLGMIGRQADPIQEMQVVHFPDGGGAAYDDTVIILASPSPKALDLLTSAVKRYKGLLSGPSLASSNRSFAKISKRARQDNAVTLWLNVNETYQGLMKILPPDDIPQQIHMANGLVDFENVDDIIASLSIKKTGIALEANAHLKEGHNCVAYNMIRTPHLSQAAWRAIPADAIALVSLALGEPGTAQAEAVGEQILNATSLDIGREIFSNIEQITLFAVPVKGSMEAVEGEIPPQAKAFGLAITSANPQQTRDILTSVLRSANMLLTQTEPVNGRYEITLANYQSIHGYMDQTSKITLLSLNPDLVTSSVTTLKQGRADSGKGVLKSAVSALPETTSKLVMVNLAGAIQFGLQNMDVPDDELGEQVRQAMSQLAEATERTTLRLQTNEEANSFGIHLSINDLPPVSEIVGPITQIQQLMVRIEGQAKSWGQQGPTAGIAETKTAPRIDGQEDGVWADAPQYELKNSYYAAPSSETDFSASFKALYDRTNLYVLVTVADDDLQNDSEEFWLDDMVEVFIDADNSKRGEYDDNDFQYHFGWDASAPPLGESQHNNMTGIEAAFAKTGMGYRAEIKLPWSTLGTKPIPGAPIGFDVQASDDDGGGERDSKLAWHARQDDAYLHPNVFGTAHLLGLVGHWTLDTVDDREVRDNSRGQNVGTLRGDPQTVTGKMGGALAFDGDEDHIVIGNEPRFDASSGVTVAAWIKVNAFDKPWQAIVTKGDNAWRIQRNNEEDTLEFACTGLNIPGGNQYGSLYGPRAISTDRWYHVAGVYDGKKMSLYVDGVLDASQDASGSINMTDVPVLIGANAEMPDRFWNGALDDVRVYNYALSGAEVAALAGK